MKCCVLRKVIFRVPGTRRLVWGIVLSENEGVALLFIKRLNADQPHRLAFCCESFPERMFQLVEGCQFPLEDKDLMSIGAKLQFLGEALQEEELKEMLKPEDLNF